MTAGELLIIFGIRTDTSSVNKAENALNRLYQGVRRLVLLRGFEQITGFIEHTTEAATHLIAFSNAMGLTVQQTQEWGYVAQQSGSNLQQLAVGFGMFDRNLRNFSQGRGGKQIAATFSELGISMADAKKALGSPDGMNALLLRTSERFKAMGNDGERAALGMSAFGARAGRAVVADMARGSAAIQELMNRRKAMGELDSNQATNLRDLGNRVKDIKTQFEAMGSIVLAKLAPALIRMADAAMEWMNANKDVISGAFEAAFEGVAFVFARIGDAISVVVAIIKWLKDEWDQAADGSLRAQFILLGIAVAITAALIPAFTSLMIVAKASILSIIESLLFMGVALAGVLIEFWPFLLIGAAIAGIALLVIKYWGPIKDFFIGVWDAIVGGLKTTWGAITEFGDDVSDFFSSIWNGIGDALKAVFDWMRDLPVIKQILDAIDWARDKMGTGGDVKQGEDVDKPWYERAYDATKNFVTDGTFGGAAKTLKANAGGGDSGGGDSPVTINSTVNINGVAHADQVPGAMEHAADTMARRHAAAALSGGR